MSEKENKPHGPDGYIAVDLDGTLAHYEGWKGPENIGKPVPLMLTRVREWLAKGIKVKIFTARAAIPEQIPPVLAWLELYELGGLEVTCTKDRFMRELWDDRAVQVVPNTGERADGYEK